MKAVVRNWVNRVICTILGHSYDEEQHDIHQKYNVYAVCNYDKCERCGLEQHKNSLYCDKVMWRTTAESVAYRPPVTDK